MRSALAIALGLGIFWTAALEGRSAVAREPLAPGLNELVIMDPGTHERGLPAVVLAESEGALRVEIPPKVHIHRYYYSGDKEFQGPIIEGGPTTVVANHPKTGEPMYINVTLPPGAPRIAHDKHGITYVYPNQRVAIHFQHFPFDPEKAAVKYHSGQGVGRTLDQARQHLMSGTKSHFQQSELTQSIKESTHNTGDVLRGVSRSAACAGSTLLDGANALVTRLPGVAPLQSLADQRAESKRAAEIRGADLLKSRVETQFVPTNR